MQSVMEIWRLSIFENEGATHPAQHLRSVLAGLFCSAKRKVPSPLLPHVNVHRDASPYRHCQMPDRETLPNTCRGGGGHGSCK